jgi:hypothetical protein
MTRLLIMKLRSCVSHYIKTTSSPPQLQYKYQSITLQYFKMAPKIAIVFYSTWGHVKTLALAEKKGIEEAGGSVTLYQYVV